MNVSKQFEKPVRIGRILIIQLGDIGDVVWSLPALHAVREAYPEAEISVLLREGNGSLLEASASRLKIFEVRKPFRESLRLIRELRRQRFGFVFDFRGDERGAYMALLSGAPVRAAIHLPMLPGLRNRLFTHLVTPRPVSMAVNAADASLDLLGAFGIGHRSAVPRLDLTSEMKSRAEGMLAGEGLFDAALPTTAGGPRNRPEEARERTAGSKGGSGPVCGGDGSEMRSAIGNVRHPRAWVTLNPFSRWPYKEWSVGKWVQLIDWLGEAFGITAVVVGSPAERERAAGLASACREGVCNMAGKTTLAELAAILSLSPLHIGVDSAAPHIAAAVGTATVTLYGPSDWRYWAPRGGRHRAIAPDMDCAPCSLKGCGGEGVSRCLEGLAVERVEAVLREVLSA